MLGYMTIEFSTPPRRWEAPEKLLNEWTTKRHADFEKYPGHPAAAESRASPVVISIAGNLRDEYFEQ
jgi:hypothetical protein